MNEITNRGPRIAWERFRMGDRLSLAELKELVKNIDDALPLLQTMPEGGAVLRCVLQDRAQLTDIINARKSPLWK